MINLQIPWYEKDRDHAHSEIFNEIEDIDNEYKEERRAMFFYMSLYGNTESFAYELAPLSFKKSGPSPLRESLRWNICQQVTDTLVSKGSKNKPKCRFISTGGDWGTKKKVEKLEKYTWAQFQSLNMHQKGRQMLKDSIIWGTGIIKICHKDGNPIAERVFPWEIYVHPLDSVMSNPSQMFQKKIVSKQALAADFPEYERKIMNANIDSETSYFTKTTQDDYVEVVEAWFVDEENGRHVICIQDCTLCDEKYTDDEFPFVIYRWNKRCMGFFGQGAIEQLKNIQVEINKTLLRIQQSMKLLGVPWVLIEKNAEIVKDNIANRIGQVIRFHQTPPRIDVHPAIDPQVISYLELLYRRAFEIVGLTQMSVSGRKEPGVTAAVAMREMQDIESDRFMSAMMDYEDTFVDIGKKLIKVGKQIAEEAEDNDYEIKVKGDRFFNSIKWSDIDLEEDQYQIQVFPVSSLPSRPEGKLQKVNEYLLAGWISRDQGMELLALPDIESYEKTDRAHLDIIHHTVDQILETAEMVEPDPLDDLSYAYTYARNVYHLARREGAPEESLEALREYIQVIDQRLKEAEQQAMTEQQMMQAQQQAGMQTGQPIANPQQPPQSELLPALPLGAGPVPGALG